MSEKMYALLFRLFPRRFRELWQEDALELFRDRARDERGLIPRLRLWFDLMADLTVSLPRAYLIENPALVPVQPSSQQGVPTFQILEENPIRSSAYLFGTLFTILALAGVSLLAKHGGHLWILPEGAASQSGFTVDPWATGKGGDGSGGSTEVIGNGTGSSAGKTAESKPASVVHVAGAQPMTFFDAAERRRVITGISATLSQHYSDPAIAQRLGGSLQANERSGKYDSVDDPYSFASLLTRQLRTAANDNHFEVVYSQVPLRDYMAPTSGQTAAYRSILLQANCTFEKVDFLPHNIGYLKLDSFPDVDVCGDAAIAAMKKLSRADALIIDLRDNSGGSPEMVMFLGGWLFDRPVFFYNPRESSAARMWTHSPMAGSGLAGKPVWVLTSSRTFSAAEHFSYNLKMLHRAVLVGEKTAGATDVGVFHRVDEHFGIGLRESRVPNSYLAPDWAVNGVQPDVAVAADEALNTAENLAQAKLGRR